MYSADLRASIVGWLEKTVPRPRLRHILSVEETSRRWAQIYGLDQERAGWAGLTHDLAKYFPHGRLLELSRQEGVELDSILRGNPHLLHADIGAIVARDRFGITDPEILSAVRNHTLGQPGMAPLDCVVFAADALEPFRGQSPELEAARRVVETHLYHGVLAVCDRSIQFLQDKQLPIHPRTQSTRDWFAKNLSSSPLPIIQEYVA